MTDNRETQSQNWDRRNTQQCLSLLEWDSQHFGFSIARIIPSDLTPAELGDVLESARVSGIRLLYWFTSDFNLPAHNVVDRYGAVLADRRATFRRNLTKHTQGDCANESDEIRIFEMPCQPASEDMLQLGVLAGRYSRFGIDSRIPRDRFESLFERWVDRSARHEIADAVFVAQTKAGAIDGFVTVARKEETGVIGLIAVAEQAQGRGIGRRLLESAECWMASKGISISMVITQMANEPACRLYSSAGYTRATIERVYHFWLSTDGQT